jgi:hypothetical protein
LGRRTPCHARRTEYLAGHLALIQAYYNFLRPHRALKFGKTLRTPAMQAGLAKKRLSLRDLFTSQAVFFLFFLIVVLMRIGRLDYRSVLVKGGATPQQQLPNEAPEFHLYCMG